MAIDAEIKEIASEQRSNTGHSQKSISRDENKYVTVKSFVKTPGISKIMPQSTIYSGKKRPSKTLRVCFIDPFNHTIECLRSLKVLFLSRNPG